jgi:steroid delta-isomerase
MVDRAAIDNTIDAYLAAFTAGDREAWLGCFTEDAWIEDPVGTPRREGREAIGSFWDETHAVPDGVELRPLGIRVVIGAESAFTMQARPNLRGDVYALDIIDHMTFDDDGRITTMRAFFDAAAMRPADD